MAADERKIAKALTKIRKQPGNKTCATCRAVAPSALGFMQVCPKVCEPHVCR